MKRLLFLVLALTVLLPARAADPAPVYELRVYTAAEGRMPDLLARFRDHTCALFAKHGMENIGYWTAADPAADGDRLFYVLRHASRAAAQAAWAAFRADPVWTAAKAASETRGPLTAGITSTFLAPTDYSPAPAPYDGPPRLFELRTYTAAEGKLAALDARFRDHTCALFARHGMTNLPYWHPTDASQGAADTLIYLLAHRDRAAAQQAWAGFRADPARLAAPRAPAKDGRGTAPGGGGSVGLVATDFAPLR